MSEAIIAAKIGLSGVIIGAVLTFAIEMVKSFFQKKQSNRRISVQYITNKRVDWIYEVRNTMAEFVSCAEQIIIGYDEVSGEKLGTDLAGKIWTDYYKLQLLFNYQGKADADIIKSLDLIMENLFHDVDDDSYNEAKYNIDSVVGKTQIYLKNEWERVKKEAG